MVHRSATIQDVARAAGVSTATVSRALSNPDLVAEQTRDAVFEAIKRTGYRVNQAARNLRMRRAGAVLVLVPDLGIPFYSKILAGISDGFAATDYAVLIADTKDSPLDDSELAAYFTDGRIDGVISLDGRFSREALDACEREGLGKRIVFLCEWVEGASFPAIRSDNAHGARLAIRHLYELGHRRIAHATGPQGNVLTIARRDAMLEERARLDLPARDEWIIRGDFSVESGHRAAQRIVEMSERPTAVFCSADTVAFGLISGLQGAGLSVPNDISVVGFDDIDIAQYYVPALTTIYQDRHRLGRRAAERLLERLNPSALDVGDEAGDLVGVKLVVRDSAAALHAGD
ncbi:LacI family DNA-binding transcriptional regulator [Ahrensia marina]|uniref:LacI family DNA-binding transcriptional regulator n=1 Tax=Ahrensia marina TaxID=1514904 RepID=UPI0035CE8E66